MIIIARTASVIVLRVQVVRTRIFPIYVMKLSTVIVRSKLFLYDIILGCN